MTVPAKYTSVLSEDGQHVVITCHGCGESSEPIEIQPDAAHYPVMEGWMRDHQCREGDR